MSDGTAVKEPPKRRLNEERELRRQLRQERRFFLLLRVYGTSAFNIIGLWALIALLAYSFTLLYELNDRVRILLLMACAVPALNGVLRTVTHLLFNPKGQGTRLVQCSQPIARHVSYYLRLIGRLTAFFVPVAIGLGLLGYPKGFVQVIWLGFEIIVFLLLVALFYRRALMKELVPETADSAAGNLVLKIVRVAYPGVALYLLSLIVLFGLGYQNLVGYLGLSTLLTATVVVLGVLVWKFLSLQMGRWEQRLLAQVEEGGRADEVEVDKQQRMALFNALRGFIRFAVVIAAVTCVLLAWRIQWSQLIGVLVYPLGGELTLATFVESLAVVLLTLLVARFVRQVLRHRLLARTDLDRGTQSALSNASFFILFGLGIYFALLNFGVDFTAFNWAIATLGVGVGFGLQNIVNNFVSGIILLVEKPVKTDDIVDVGGNWGTVDRIGVRSTTIINQDNIAIILPNSQLIEKEVINWSHRDIRTRLKVAVGVAYGSDLNLVRKALLEVAERHGLVLKKPAPDVRFRGFGDSSLNFELHVYVSDLWRKERIVSDLNFSIDATFRKNAIEIPFPQRDLHLVSALPLQVEAAPRNGSGAEKVSDGAGPAQEAAPPPTRGELPA